MINSLTKPLIVSTRRTDMNRVPADSERNNLTSRRLASEVAYKWTLVIGIDTFQMWVSQRWEKFRVGKQSVRIWLQEPRGNLTLVRRNSCMFGIVAIIFFVAPRRMPASKCTACSLGMRARKSMQSLSSASGVRYSFSIISNMPVYRQQGRTVGTACHSGFG